VLICIVVYKHGCIWEKSIRYSEEKRKNNMTPKGPKAAKTPGFQSTIKPYFTPCYRTHMINATGLDLWDASEVQDSWGDINGAVSSSRMPAPGCPEGVWDKATQQQFLADFLAWKSANFPP